MLGSGDRTIGGPKTAPTMVIESARPNLLVPPRFSAISTAGHLIPIPEIHCTFQIADRKAMRTQSLRFAICNLKCIKNSWDAYKSRFSIGSVASRVHARSRAKGLERR